MPVGGYLDSLPTMLFVLAHVVFLAIGFWAYRRAQQARLAFSVVFLLYMVTQLGFLAFFGGAVTLKMAVLFEQTLMLIVVFLLVRKPAA